MLEKPQLQDQEISSCLYENFEISIDNVTFLPIGNDPNSWLYKIDCNNQKYFLKIKKGEIYEPSILVPKYLKTIGIHQVIVPVSNKLTKDITNLENYKLVLYPFIEGETARKFGMSDDKWIEFGKIIKKIHNAQLPTSLAPQIRKENFATNWNEIIQKLRERIYFQNFTESVQKEFSSFWKEKDETIKNISDKMSELGRLLQSQQLDLVLCHTDIHTDNILLDQSNNIFIIDWDNPLFAPKERDLMFMIDSNQEKLFFEGYGECQINQNVLSYYQNKWLAQEICDYAERILSNDNLGIETKEQAMKLFVKLFSTIP